jgi:hypothetical protein
MGFRFRKSIKIAPGVRLNLSKSGISASAGVRGATVNVGKRGVTASASIPGTGVGYSTNLTAGTVPAQPRQKGKGFNFAGCFLWLIIGVVAFAVLVAMMS